MTKSELKYNDICRRRIVRCCLSEEPLFRLICNIIDSYQTAPGKGLPLGNQTSQWFALWYLDPLDRLIKEKLRLSYYSRYMDDGIILSPDKEYLKFCLGEMRKLIENDLMLEFNEKTQILPIKNGASYLGWHLYLTDTGKVVRKLKPQSKKRMIRRLKKLKMDYSLRKVELEDARQVITSYFGYLSHGHTYHLRKKTLCSVTLSREKPEETHTENLSPNYGKILIEKENDDKITNLADKRASLNLTQRRILSEMRDNPKITQVQLMTKLGIGRTAIQNNVSFLSKNGYIKRVGANKNGIWSVLITSK